MQLRRSWCASTSRSFAVRSAIGCWFFSPDRRTIGVGTAGGTVALCDARTGRQRPFFEGKSALLDLEFAGSGRALGTLHADGKARLWDPASAKELATVPLQNSRSRHMALSPDGRALVLANHPGNAQVAVYHVGRVRPLISKELASTVTSVCHSPDGRTFASGDYNGQIIFWITDTLGERGRIVSAGDSLLSWLIPAMASGWPWEPATDW